MAYVKWTFSILLLVAVAAFLHYSLPQRDVVRIVGTEVKREDVRTEQGLESRDVRQINAFDPDDGPRVYRNEDTGFGWPPYFKFDSADLAAKAENAISTKAEPEWVVIRHYGWRVPWFSMFPNALSIRPADGPEEPLYPWFNGVIVLALIVTFLLLRRFVLGVYERHVEPVIDSVDQGFDDASEFASRKATKARGFFGRLFGR